jgi:hypothetical protein
MEFKTQFVLMLPEPENNRWSAFNPSIAEAGDGSGYAMTIRSSNYIFSDKRPQAILTQGTMVQSRVWFARLDKDAKTILPRKLYRVRLDSDVELKRGAEDARLFWRDGGWKFTATIMETHTPVGRMTLWNLDDKSMIATLEKVYPGQFEKIVEKNWIPTSDGGGDFDYIYGPNIVYKDGKFVEVGPQEGLPALRGGSQLLADGDGYLAVCHVVSLAAPHKKVFSNRTFSMVQSRERKYEHLFVRYDKSGRVLATSPIFDFGYADIEYVAGLVRRGDDLVLSFGVDDKKTFIAEIPYSEVIDSLVEFSYD